eukprot:TRINITY_DN1134_c0_g1_i11.p1 TRINITY_DN1134_c0_g1~~TRINITY_DN1134_c0_g1_i11.p1  ORF type:complete len:331 (+),score=77.92 TRINITY_DN1134_c0_g1_i11:111-1103(+)
MQSVHCKVSLDDQIRRFQFTSSSGGVESNFSNLQTRIRTLFGIVGEFTLRYKDDEGDLILVESDDEFKYAFTESAGLLRIFVELKNKPPTPTDALQVYSPSSISPAHDQCGRGKHGGRGRGGRGGGRGGRGRCGKTKIERMTSKREYILSLLATPEVTADERKRQRLQRKLESIETRLAILNSKTTSTDTTTTTTQSETVKVNDDEETESSSSLEQKPDSKNKKEKTHRKCRHRQPNVRRTLTPEDKNMLVVLKAQIRELKPSFNAVKIQLSVKKEEKAETQAKGDTVRVEQLKKEIQQLKEIQREHRKAIAPLKEQIYALKFEPKREQI